MSKKEQSITEETSVKIDAQKTGVVEHKKSLENLTDQKVDGDNVLGGVNSSFISTSARPSSSTNGPSDAAGAGG